eukprot:CAMPEP_0175128078 /NCGR_PEP_ID=MMETSP0087-20121206/4735_1 /TAXON_ID=136419 /ORGANISM="Unknown Unknown, Strain D1" /LENGTH=719 /DNA_ID=CAMNT_0016410113 /DNA_START=120 /DNA_END=2279 /DNA_ORIENTATION=+
MNGEYLPLVSQGMRGNWSTNFSDYPGGVEYFEVYAGPITTTYSEVFWTALPEIKLPLDLVKRFDGKAMAVVGFEADQVRRTKEGDVSVPINIAYNHHYGAMLLGKGSKVERVKRDRNDPTQPAHPGPVPGYVDVAVEHTPSQNGLPTSMVFGYSNGGEFRKTYHALAPPFAQLVESPSTIHITPMQIDTWNRDAMNLTGSPFVPGPAPENSLAPLTGIDAVYSGLLECPLTTRIRKHITGGGWNDSYVPQIFSCHKKPQGCQHGVDTMKNCFTAAQELGLPVKTEQVSSSTLPPGCSVNVNQNKTSGTVFWNSNLSSSVCCGEGVAAIEGEQTSLVKLSLSLSEDGVIITMSGPSKVWFGVGFDAIAMANSPYAIVVDGSGKVSEHVLGPHKPGIQINTSVAVVSDTVETDLRTVVMKRPLKGMTPHHYTFDPLKLKLNFINAVGSSPDFSYHKAKTTATLSLWPSAEHNSCLCTIPAAPFGKGVGTLEYLPTGEKLGFPLRCDPEPRETVLANRNPTCDIRTYAGGLSTCHHGWHLLDADQEIPWQDQPIEYYLKFRLYYQPYDPKHHVNAFDMTWSMAGDTGEYDVPQCKAGTPAEKCTHEVSGVITPPADKNLHFVAAHYHCHAPTCLFMEVYNNLTGELICREDTYHGEGADIAGKDRFDETGYIAQRICLWGDHPLPPPPNVSGVPLFVRSVTNNTYGHHGEMALPQMLLASIP